jgi:hypothetical protein
MIEGVSLAKKKLKEKPFHPLMKSYEGCLAENFMF